MRYFRLRYFRLRYFRLRYFRLFLGAALAAALAGCAQTVKQTDPDLKINPTSPPGYAQAHPAGAPGGLHRMPPAAAPK